MVRRLKERNEGGDQQGSKWGWYVEDNPSQAELPHKVHVRPRAKSQQPTPMVRLRGELPLLQCPQPKPAHPVHSSVAGEVQGRHSKVLKKLADILETRSQRPPFTNTEASDPFCSRRRRGTNISQEQRSVLTGGCEWDLRVDLEWSWRRSLSHERQEWKQPARGIRTDSRV